MEFVQEKERAKGGETKPQDVGGWTQEKARWRVRQRERERKGKRMREREKSRAPFLHPPTPSGSAAVTLSPTLSPSLTPSLTPTATPSATSTCIQVLAPTLSRVWCLIDCLRCTSSDVPFPVSLLFFFCFLMASGGPTFDWLSDPRGGQVTSEPIVLGSEKAKALPEDMDNQPHRLWLGGVLRSPSATFATEFTSGRQRSEHGAGRTRKRAVQGFESAVSWVQLVLRG